MLFNPLAPGYFVNPYEQYAALHAHAPVLLEPTSGCYIVTRYADVHRLSRDRSMVAELSKANPTSFVETERALVAADGGRVAKMMLRRDGDDHARLRRLMGKAFTPKAVLLWRQRAESIVQQLLTKNSGTRVD